MTLSTKRLRLSRSEQSTETAATDRASKSVPNPGISRKASVPSIINELYSAPTPYPGEDPAPFERLLEELEHAVAPTGLIQWLLVADLRAAILDERRYRDILDMIMSSKELIEREQSAQDSEYKQIALKIFFRRGGADMTESEEVERNWKESLEEADNQYEVSRARENAKAPERERRFAIENFQIHFQSIEKLHFLAERSRKTKMSIVSQLEAMKAVSSSLATEIEDVEFTEAAE